MEMSSEEIVVLIAELMEKHKLTPEEYEGLNLYDTEFLDVLYPDCTPDDYKKMYLILNSAVSRITLAEPGVYNELEEALQLCETILRERNPSYDEVCKMTEKDSLW